MGGMATRDTFLNDVDPADMASHRALWRFSSLESRQEIDAT